MDKKIFNKSLAWLMLPMALLSAGCSSTEVLDEPTEQVKSDEIVFNVDIPQELKSRATSDHMLRFTAFLYEGEYASKTDGVKFMEKKQVTTGNGSGQIVFKVVPGVYQILLFADYIPSSSTPQDGIYPDKYYDTSSTEALNGTVKMLGFGNLTYNGLSNPNYDCFTYVTEVINKSEDKYERAYVLTRPLSKIRFVSTTNYESRVRSITFNSFNFYDQYSIYGKSTFIRYDNLRLSNHTLDGMSDASQNELFYFYSFASPDQTLNMRDYDFTITFEDGTSRRVNIPFSSVYVLPNHIMTVRGAFLADPAPDEPELGDIILNLTRNESWTNEETIII